MKWSYLLFPILLIGGGWFFWALFISKPAVKNFPLSATKTGPIVFFGDSLVEGVGASNGKDMSRLIAQSLGEPVLNYGVSGNTTTQALSRIAPALEEHPRLAIILLGGNDFLQHVPRETIAINLESIVTQFQNEGAVVLLVGVRSGILSGGSDKFYEAIAKKTEAAYEPDILKGIFGDTALMSDAVHPNDMGYAKIAHDRLLPTLKRLLEKK